MRRWAAVVLALALLIALWQKTGWSEMWTLFSEMDLGWLTVALLLFIPQTLVSGWRWAQMVGAWQPLSWLRATELVLGCSALNLILPSKLGDLAKGACLQTQPPQRRVGLWLTLLEKALDASALGLIMCLGLGLVLPDQTLGWMIAGGVTLGLLGFGVLWQRIVAERLVEGAGKLAPLGSVILTLRSQPARLLTILLSTGLLWVLHLAQFSVALWALGGELGPSILWSRIALAIFIGLVPVTLAGIGTRDAALVYFLGPSLGQTLALGLGAFATVRYLLPAAVGLLFAHDIYRWSEELIEKRVTSIADAQEQNEDHDKNANHRDEPPELIIPQ